jgi:C1A family cysteine protease/putative hemolysin
MKGIWSKSREKFCINLEITFRLLFLVLSLLLIFNSSSSADTDEDKQVSQDSVFDNNVGMPDPSAVYCLDLGYEYKTITRSNGSQYGICIFPDKTSCKAWDFIKGKCAKDRSVCALHGLATMTKNDGKNPFSKEYAVCVDTKGNIVDSVIDISGVREKVNHIKTKNVDQTIGILQTPMQVPQGVSPLPSSFDWRNICGSNWITTVKAQGYCGSCWAFAAVGVAEAVKNISSHNPGLDLDLSEQYLVTDCALNAGNCAGGAKSAALEYIRDNGIPDENCFPYDDGYGITACTYYNDGNETKCLTITCTYYDGGECSDHRCSDRCADWESRLITINSVTSLGFNPPIDLIKQALVNHGPVAVSMNMGGESVNDIYVCPDNSNTNHAVIIVGYNDSGNYWIVKNSWGDDDVLGDNGYFKVAYNNCAIQTYPYYVNTSPLFDDFPLNSTVNGYLSETHPLDIWKITLPTDGKITFPLTFDSTLNIAALYIYDSDGSSLVYDDGVGASPQTLGPYGLKAGTYYVKIEWYQYSGSTYGGYTLSNVYTEQPLGNDCEPNDSHLTACSMSPNGTVTGHLGYKGGGNASRDTQDWWKITLPTDGKITFPLTFDSTLNIAALYIYDSDGSSLVYDDGVGASPQTLGPYGLKAGTYYVKIEWYQYSGSTYGGYTLSNSFDTEAPTGSITINSGAAYAKSTSVTLSLSATDPNGVSQMCISNTNTCSSWITYATSKSWTLPAGDGTKTVYVLFKDGVGNANASSYTDTIILDTTGPANGVLDASAGHQQVALSWSGFSDATSGIGSYKLVFSTGSFPSSCSSGTQIYSGSSTSYNHTGLTNGTTYYYRVCAIDNAQNTSSGATKSAKPTSSDTTPPTGSITINGGATYANTTSVTLNVTADDPSGVSQMCISNTNTCSSWISYATSTPRTLPAGDGTKTVYVWFKDGVGNANTSPFTDTIILDTAAPTNGTLSAVAGDMQVSLSWSGFSDATSGIGSYKLVFSTSGMPSSCSSGTQIHSGSSTSYNHTGLTNGTTYYYRVCAIDNAQNTSSGATISAKPFGETTAVDLPKTGQTICFDAYGNVCLCGDLDCPRNQDGRMRAGYPWPDPRFIVNGDCVIDNLTGLMWAKSPDSIQIDWQQAVDYANNLILCDYTDWRLPNVNELESLVNAGQANPAQWLNLQGFSNIHDAPYWSSTTFASIIEGAWLIDFGSLDGRGRNGGVLGDYKSRNTYVLPVRGTTTPPTQLWKTGQMTSYAPGDDGDVQAGVSWPNPRLTDNGNGTLRDNLTGLVWLKDANCISTRYPSFDNDSSIRDGRVTWQHALEFVAGINSGLFANCAAGQSDWRLPNRKELFSLIDFSRWEPALPYGHLFVNLDIMTPPTCYWSSTTQVSYRENAWWIDMWGGGVGERTKTSDCFVLPVRAGHVGIFVDVGPSFWAYDYIMALYDARITSGYADGTYQPSVNVTRGQMAAFIIRAKYGEDFSYSSTPHFSDVPNGHWAFKYIQKMYESGITTGYSDGTYRPAGNVTRGQMAAFIVRGKFGETFPYNTTPYFSDVPSSHGSFKYIQKVTEEGIASGYSDGTYRPSQYVNRAQMAAFIGRAFLKME